MAADPNGLDLDLAKAVYDEMLAVVEKEANRRHILKRMVGCHDALKKSTGGIIFGCYLEMSDKRRIENFQCYVHTS